VNSDGQLSQADRDAHARTRFDAADTDSNGQLSFAEASAMHEQRREMRSERREERGGARMERMGFGPMHGPGPMRGARLEAADTDDNGTVSQAEFTAHALTRFDAADADNNGTVTRDEMRDMRESHRGEGRGRGFRQG
jgi:EF hand